MLWEFFSTERKPDAPAFIAAASFVAPGEAPYVKNLDFRVDGASVTAHRGQMQVAVTIASKAGAVFPDVVITGRLQIVVPGSVDDSLASLGDRALKALAERLTGVA